MCLLFAGLFRCRTSGEATLLKIRLDGYASNLKVFVDGNRFVANGPRYTAQSIGSAVAVSLRCNTQSSLVVLSNNLFMNHVAQQGSGIQVSLNSKISLTCKSSLHHSMLSNIKRMLFMMSNIKRMLSMLSNIKRMLSMLSNIKRMLFMMSVIM